MEGAQDYTVDALKLPSQALAIFAELIKDVCGRALS